MICICEYYYISKSKMFIDEEVNKNNEKIC